MQEQVDTHQDTTEVAEMPSKEPEPEPEVITVDDEAQADGAGAEGEPEVSDEEAEEGGEDEYEVEQILDHRVGKPVSCVASSTARSASVCLSGELDC